MIPPLLSCPGCVCMRLAVTGTQHSRRGGYRLEPTRRAQAVPHRGVLADGRKRNAALAAPRGAQPSRCKPNLTL